MRTIKINTRKERKIIEIKIEIAQIINREIKEIRLIINGLNMSDNQSLNHYHISSSSKVFILPGLTGGANVSSCV